MKFNRGFTLVEVLVAIAILSGGVIAIMQLFPASVRQSRLAAERTTVAALAKTELGRVRAGGISNLLGPSGWAARNAFRNFEAGAEFYKSISSSVQRVGGDVDLFRVTLAVEFFDGREEKFVTYVTEP